MRTVAACVMGVTTQNKNRKPALSTALRNKTRHAGALRGHRHVLARPEARGTVCVCVRVCVCACEVRVNKEEGTPSVFDQLTL